MSFESYISESHKVRNIYECLNERCFKKEFEKEGELNSKKLVAVIPERGCYECKESFEIELKETLNKFNSVEFLEMSDVRLQEVMITNYIQFEHVTLIALDRYKTHYVFEYHPEFPQKGAKTSALLAFLQKFNQ